MLKLLEKGINRGKIGLLPLFGICVVVGVGYVIGFQRQIGKEIGNILFDTETLYQVRERQVHLEAAYLFYVCLKRVPLLVGLFLLSATYLASAAVIAATAWFGFSLGVLTASSVTSYGLRGILLILAGIFPQYLFYIPAFCLTAVLCRRRRILNSRLFLQCLILTIVVIIGCVLESYVNPIFVVKMLSIF